MRTVAPLDAARAGELERQAGLADARLAGDEEQLGPAGLRALPHLVHRLQLALAADEFDGGGCGELRRQCNRGLMRESAADRLPIS